MRFTLIAVGRGKPGPELDLYKRYAARIAPPPLLREVEVKKRLTGPALTDAEGEMILATVSQRAALIVLDERGRTMTSDAWANRLGQWQDGGVADVAIAIGGADGHSQKVRDRADLLLSLGPMTWPHMLVRALIAEQLYRAQCILSGHPYHRV